jgi:GxxExxY protein
MERDRRTRNIIGAAIEVHRRLGPGLLETAYRKCLAYELRKRGHDVAEEFPIPVMYDDLHMECGFRADLVVDDAVIVELKAKTTIHPVDKAQLLSHLRLSKREVGLLLNFHELKLIDGITRIVNDYKPQ